MGSLPVPLGGTKGVRVEVEDSENSLLLSKARGGTWKVGRTMGTRKIGQGEKGKERGEMPKGVLMAWVAIGGGEGDEGNCWWCMKQLKGCRKYGGWE